MDKDNRETAKRANIRLLTNVLCVHKDERNLSIEEIVPRLGYFEYLEYKRANPNLFAIPNYELTERQEWERNSPRGTGRGLVHLWRHRPDFHPVPAVGEPNPFLADEEPVTQVKGEPEQEHEPTHAEEPEAPEAPEEIVNEQDAVIQADTQSDILVIAPPGTGKTHVLVERIAHLVDSGKSSNPLAEIQVLSFTRSAVSELRKRLAAKVDAGGDERMLYAKIQTFDSLATQLLKLDIDSKSLASGYEKRIEQFVKNLRSATLPKSEELISRIRFLFVDEVQDLNGKRAEMVLELARRVRVSGGCTLFLGDPAQAIYDFVENGNSGGLTSTDFLEDLIQGRTVGRRPSPAEFSQYRRYETQEILSFVNSARAAMGENGLNPDGAQLDELLRSLGTRLPIEELSSIRELQGRTALLTRNNLEAYWLWRYCKQADIPATLWRGATGNYWPGWIARLFLDFQNDAMSLEMAERRWMKLIAQSVAISFVQAMSFLRDHGVIDDESGHIRVTDLNYLVGNAAPVQRDSEIDDHIVISTIHRSKGLEFENVFLYAPATMDADDEVRVIYVAATRAKRRLGMLERNDRIVRRGKKQGAGLKTSRFHVFKFPAYPHIGLLIDGSDAVDPDSVLTLDDPLNSQKDLWDKTAVASRDLTIKDGMIRCYGIDIGEVEDEIKKDLSKIMLLRKVVPPSAGFSGLISVDVATVALDQDNPAAKHTLGTACLCMVPVVSGMVSI